MRIRTVKPEFWSHPVLASEQDNVRLAAIGLLNIADDEGYFLAKPALIRSAIWPLDEDSAKARRTLERLSELGYIELSEHPTHGLIGRVVNFTKHQRVDRPSQSKIKSYFDSTNNLRGLDDHSCQEQGTGNREQVSGNVGSKPSARDEMDICAPSDNPEIADADKWHLERSQSYVRSLVASGCKIGPNSWPRWRELAKELGLSVILKAAKQVQADDRFADKVEIAARQIKSEIAQATSQQPIKPRRQMSAEAKAMAEELFTSVKAHRK